MSDRLSRAGVMLGPYRILEPLGEGGMGVVYLAEDTRLGRKVALKLLPAATRADPTQARRFEQEARAAATLTHPAIAAVYELGESDGELFIAFEYVKGGTLRSLVCTGGLNAETVVEIALDVAGALDAAHAAGIVHRDLKPENVMRTAEGGCKVLDFGLAHFATIADDAATHMRLTQAGAVIGTVGYMSPEQLEGTAVDFRSDVFSLGVLLYELATGVHPFQSATAASTISAILTADPLPIAARTPVQPAEIDRIVRKCLRKRREDRYQSTRDLVVDLKNLRRDSSGIRAAHVRRTEPQRGVWWFWAHNLSTCFLSCPLAAWLAWMGREALASTTGNGLFLAEALSLCVIFALRITLMSVAIGNPPALAREAGRLSGLILGASLAIVAGLLALGAAVATIDIGLAAAIAGFGVMGIVATLVINPALDRAAFGGEHP